MKLIFDGNRRGMLGYNLLWFFRKVLQGAALSELMAVGHFETSTKIFGKICVPKCGAMGKYTVAFKRFAMVLWSANSVPLSSVMDFTA